jgi:L-threonylcarbamoyladenylate synthase
MGSSRDGAAPFDADDAAPYPAREDTGMSDVSEPGSTATRRLGPDQVGIAEAASLLRAGALVAFPTETVYGLGADASDPRAVAGIYAAKGRPRFNPLIAHLAEAEAALAEGVFDARAEALAQRFWPGPLTLVVPVRPGGRTCELARAGLDTVALRVPSHPVARALLRAAERPVAAPSANVSGRVSPTTAAHVAADLDGRIAAIVDSGPTQVGLESTIVAVLPGEVPRLLRPGGVPRAALEEALGGAIADAMTDVLLAPGGLASHYAPRASLRLDAETVEAGEAGLLFGPGSLGSPAADTPILDLSPAGDLREAASNLFAHLRALDTATIERIAVARLPAEGLGEAIADRLRRAAAPRT